SLNDSDGVTIGVDATDIFSADVNPERIEIDFKEALIDLEDFDTVISQGSSLGDVTGIVDYSGTVYELQLTEPIEVTPGNLEPELSELEGSDTELSIAAYNVLNLDTNDGADLGGDNDVADGRFDAIANQIIDNLNTPDIVALQEIQDNDGAADEGGDTEVVAADETLQLLVDTIAANGGPQYEFLDNPFIGDDANGGEPGGNIRTAFIYNPERVDFVEDSLRPGTDPVTQQDDIEDNNAFESSRIPLVADFTFNDETVTVISVHNTAGGIENFGNIQPVIRSGSDTRSEQGAELNAFVDDILAEDPEAKVVIAGDWNGFDYEEWDPFTEGTVDGGEQVLFNLTDTLPELERYTFQFSNGNSTPLDHIFLTENLTDGAEFDAVHVTAEFPDIPSRASDHDPILTTITLGEADVPDAPLPNFGSTEADELAIFTSGELFFAGDGDDSLKATESSGGNTIFGGSGSDEFFLGTADSLLGNEGDDLFFALRGGENTITGGAGTDQFWLASAEIPDSPNTVVDFTLTEDVIGLGGLGISFDDISLTQQESDTIVALGDDDLGILQGIAADSLDTNSFVFI
ncbi:MAG: endonuclease/exonuclease/phosphatase family protein, partial [Cyanobacteria bacterium P01_A01_bin.83]